MISPQERKRQEVSVCAVTVGEKKQTQIPHPSNAGLSWHLPLSSELVLSHSLSVFGPISKKQTHKMYLDLDFPCSAW